MISNYTGDPALLHHLISSKTIDMPSIETLDIAVLKDLANECSMTLPAGASKIPLQRKTPQLDAAASFGEENQPMPTLRDRRFFAEGTIGVLPAVKESPLPQTGSEDQQLLTKLSCGGDLVALEAKYHATCLAKLYRKAQTSSYDDNGEEKIVRPEGIALAELVAYIEESTLTIFKLADLAKAYKSRSEHDRLDINRIAMVDAFQEEDVTSLVATFEDLGNPFIEESEDLLVLDTKEIAAPDAVGRLRQIETIGRDQFDTFLTERLLDRKKSLYDPIKRNKLSLFASPPSRKTSKTAHQLTSMKRDCSLFARLYISCQTREGDLDDFFKHENQGCPPSLSNFGKLRLPKNKSQLTECLEADSTVRSEMPNSIDVTIIDGAVLVHMIKPGTEKTFSEYASQSFLPYIQAQSRHVDRLDVVWDEYVENSLKATTRGNRGAGVRRRVAGTNRLPSNWKEFLRVDENKRELFKFLAECISNLDVQKQIITTYGDQVLCTLPRDTSSLAPCSHEEADTRMMLHVQDAVQHGYEKIMLRTVDTDVLILAVAVLSQLSEHARPELWLAFGTGNHLRYIAAHEISSSLGPQTSKALPVFHAFTGCDTVSCFGGRGKNTALEVWKLRAALVEHTKRAAYQAGYCWGQALKPRPVLPSPEKWGWTLSEGTWEPFCLI
ncbi:hypothetical protein QZH41_002431 [Actinostola sp. cb2023]|nr:hypothetical protein QZH41_002431 [Actinostola sp. cb2023]